jgi:hypothetical protein
MNNAEARDGKDRIMLACMLAALAAIQMLEDEWME